MLGAAPAGAAPKKTASKLHGFTAKSQKATVGTTMKFPVKVTVRGRASVKRTVVLQRWSGGKWVRVTSARTNKNGRVSLRYRVGNRTGTARLRVKVTATRKHRAKVSKVKKVSIRPKATTTALQREMLAAVNQARSTARSCGGESFPARGALRLNTRLTRAAQGHAADMARNNFFSHTSSNGWTLVDRVNAQSYAWSTLGENIAAGYPSVPAVVQGWLDSPGHCRNIMGSFTELGVGYVKGGNANDYGNYWVQNFGTPAS